MLATFLIGNLNLTSLKNDSIYVIYIEMYETLISYPDLEYLLGAAAGEANGIITCFLFKSKTNMFKLIEAIHEICMLKNMRIRTPPFSVHTLVCLSVQKTNHIYIFSWSTMKSSVLDKLHTFSLCDYPSLLL